VTQPQHYSPATPAPAPGKTNTMAILGLVFAFVFAPLGIVFSIMGRNQIRQTGEGGAGLAKAGLILGIVFTVLSVLWFIFLVIAIGSGAAGA
jgi:hypothetical protein